MAKSTPDVSSLTGVPSRILELLRRVYDGNQSQMADEVGVSRSTINKIVNGKTSTVDESTLIKVARNSGVSERWLRNGQGEMRQDSQTASGQPDSDDGSSSGKQVTHYGPASAGDGRTLQPIGEVELTEGEYRARFGARSTDRVGLFEIEGDSAAPIYFDGEQIPVEMKGETQDFREDTVYVFRYREDIMVKRLRTLEDGSIRAESLNPGIDDRVLHPNGDNFEIVGRVIDNPKQQLYTSMVGRFMRQKGQDAA